MFKTHIFMSKFLFSTILKHFTTKIYRVKRIYRRILETLQSDTSRSISGTFYLAKRLLSKMSDPLQKKNSNKKKVKENRMSRFKNLLPESITKLKKMSLGNRQPDYFDVKKDDDSHNLTKIDKGQKAMDCVHSRDDSEILKTKLTDLLKESPLGFKERGNWENRMRKLLTRDKK
ncbi:hypothetical protein M153_1390007698 [Pseudoloma neurophilia]|uniref:Uncharacterized protein n=1 Tax=Pseudoloma neurophilia TaxID=146866 RepID=A0A0R0M6U4_9MICR|nr:hypothetical protein M153_1390007698 [Pseudoloma neurophilia]